MKSHLKNTIQIIIESCQNLIVKNNFPVSIHLLLHLLFFISNLLGIQV